MIFEYQLLNTDDRGRLRLERIRALELDLCRIELALEDALSTAEQDSLHQDAEIIRQRLRPHYAKMGLIDSKIDHEPDADAAPPGVTEESGEGP